MTEAEKALGVWAEDPRSVEGAYALASILPEGWVTQSRTDNLVPDNDPRVVATRAEINYRKSPEGHLEAVANPTRVIAMEKGKEYAL